MPELPEVETIRRDLEPLVAGRRITGVEVDPATIHLLAGAPIETLRANLVGRTVTAIGRRGKYLMFSLDDGRVFVVHLRMTIAVSERTGEIGLLVALGAPRRTILGLFLGEAVALSALGGVIGLLLGMGLAQLIHLAVPALPVHTPLMFVLLAEGLAIAIGLLAGVLPARRAAQLDPVEALRSE